MPAIDGTGLRPTGPEDRAVSVAGTTMPAVTFWGSAVCGEPGDHHLVAVVPIRHAQDSRRSRRIPRWNHLAERRAAEQEA